MTTQSEPGYGRYKDRDHYADLQGFWAHDEAGWSWHAFDGDPNPGQPRAWEEMERYLPLTPLREPAPVAADPLAINVRWSAVDFASRCNPNTATELIQYAKQIEAYLSEK